MRILVTSSRMPFALDVIRKLGRAGHVVYAADTFYSAPGSHSRYVASHFEVTPPETSPLGYLADIDQLVRRYGIERIVPCFEEVFYLSRHRDLISPATHLFAAGFELLARLHQKATFEALARSLDIPTPATRLVRDEAQLDAALARLPRFVARPAWSRGGIDIFANAGPLAGVVRRSACHPTPERPWVVQEFVDGVDLCSFGIAHHGHLVAHCTYVHPKEIEHAGGIVFESVVDEDVLAHVQRLVAGTGYHGHISLDFRRGPRGVVALECNPRPTAGVHLMSNVMFVQALLGDGDGTPRIVPPGRRRLYASALLRDAILHPRELPRDVAYLFSDAADIYAERDDRVPALFQVLSYRHVLSYRRRHLGGERPATKLMAAYFDGIRWDGQPL